MPRIVLATTGSLGDVYPFVAIALELRSAGLHPILAAAEPFRALADAEGIDFHPVRPGPADMAAAGHDEASVVRAVAGGTQAIFDLLLPHLERSYTDLAAVMPGTDLALTSGFSVAARTAADAAGVPFATVLFQPIAMMSRLDPPVVGEVWLPARVQRRVGPRTLRLLYGLAHRRLGRRRAPVDALRARLGLPAVRDELLDGPLRGAHVFALYPPAFAPLAPDAPGHAMSAGFSFYNGVQAAMLDPEVEGFLARGAPPLVFTLGSLAVHAPGDFYRTSAAAAARAGRRAILLVGDHAVASHADLASPDILVAGFAPHAALFPRAAAVIHHGGIGTVAQTLRASVPHLVHPGLGDQFDNAERLRELGLAAVLRLARYTPDAATAALGRLLGDQAIAARAKAFASRVAEDNGPRMIARFIAARLDASRPDAARLDP